MSTPNWWGDWRPNLTPHTGNLLATDLIECTMIVGGLPVNTVITGAQILGAVPSGGLTVGTTAIASGTVGRVLFQGTGNVLQQSANFFWDNTNNRLGIAQSTPTARIHIQGSSAATTSSSLVVFNSTPTEIFRIRDNGNVQIGALTDAGFKLDVNGTARFQGTITSTQIGGTIFKTSNNAYFHNQFGGLNTVDYYNGFIIQNANQVVFKTAFAGNSRFLRDSIFGSDSANTASAQVEIVSTTKGFLPPRMTNAQMLAIATPAAGLVVYDTTNNKHCGYNGTAWQNFY